jgi:hypothetical protein
MEDSSLRKKNLRPRERVGPSETSAEELAIPWYIPSMPKVLKVKKEASEARRKISEAEKALLLRLVNNRANTKRCERRRELPKRSFRVEADG